MSRDVAGNLRGRRGVLALAALFLVPLAGAFWLYYGHEGWRPRGATNQGELVTPPRPLPTFEFVGADGRRIPGDILRERWTLLYVGAGHCDPRCQDVLHLTRQTRIALNKDSERVRRVFLATGPCCDIGVPAIDAPGPRGCSPDGHANGGPGTVAARVGWPPAGSRRSHLRGGSARQPDDELSRDGARQGAARRSQATAASLTHRLITRVMKSTIFKRLCLAGTLLALCVVVLGAWVRLSHAGLGCPDWPGCYGHLTVGEALENAVHANRAWPERPLEAGKAFKEMLHRYLAAGLGMLILVIAAWAWTNRRDPEQPVRLPLLLVLLVVFQGLLGMWTVTLLLKPLFVVAHLLGGLTTLACLWWLALPPGAEVPAPRDPGLRRAIVAALTVLALQVALGGWVSSNYAALACPDFPTCQASFWPTMDFHDAFVLWRGLGIDYEGGVLDHPARVAIHYTHRVGAVIAALALGWVAWRAVRGAGTRAVHLAGSAVAATLAAQLLVGPAMVLAGLPLSLATAHNAVAALLVLATVALLRAASPPALRNRGR